MKNTLSTLSIVSLLALCVSIDAAVTVGQPFVASDTTGTNAYTTNALALTGGFMSVGLSADSTRIGLRAGTNALNAINHDFIGYQAGMLASNAQYTVAIGYRAGEGLTNGNSTIAIGALSAIGAGQGLQSVFLGTRSGEQAYAVHDVVFIGYRSGHQASNAVSSVFVGGFSGRYGTNAYFSTFVGYSSGENATNAHDSVFIGYEAGKNTYSANNSVFIGQCSGTNAANVLWIDTQATVQNGTYIPLIYGLFNSRALTINGTLDSLQRQIPRTSSLTVVTNFSGTCYNNNGAGGTITFTLPAATVGQRAEFYVAAAQTLTIAAVGTDTIRHANVVSGAAGTMDSNTVGNFVSIFCPVAGQWVVKGIIGTWNGPT